MTVIAIGKIVPDKCRNTRKDGISVTRNDEVGSIIIQRESSGIYQKKEGKIVA